MSANAAPVLQAFSYRSPRLAVSLPVEFQTEHGLLFGRTLDISEKGLLADFREPVFLESSGRLRFRTGHCLLELEAEVTHVEAFRAGLAFRFASERERSFLRTLLQALTEAAGDAENSFWEERSETGLK